MSQQPKSTDRWAFDYDMERGVTMVTLPHWAFWLGVVLALFGAVGVLRDLPSLIHAFTA